MRLALNEYAPSSLAAIHSALGEVVSANEKKALAIIREVFPEDDLDLGTAGAIKFKDALKDLKTP